MASIQSPLMEISPPHHRRAKLRWRRSSSMGVASGQWSVASERHRGALLDAKGIMHDRCRMGRATAKELRGQKQLVEDYITKGYEDTAKSFTGVPVHRGQGRVY